MSDRYTRVIRPAWLACFVLAMAATVVGCASNPALHPAAGANRLSGSATGAKATQQGVQVEAAVQTWNGKPEDLAKVEPVLVTVHNRSQHPLRVQYKSFQLVSAHGTRYRALAPLSIDKQASVAVPSRHPYYANDFGAFHTAPYWNRRYGGFGSAYNNFGGSARYYDRYNLKKIELPTEDMLDRALPEGVIDPGGKVKGYLYFERLKDDSQKVDLHTALVNAKTGKQFGRVSIPFTVGG